MGDDWTDEEFDAYSARMDREADEREEVEASIGAMRMGLALLEDAHAEQERLREALLQVVAAKPWKRRRIAQDALMAKEARHPASIETFQPLVDLGAKHERERSAVATSGEGQGDA